MKSIIANMMLLAVFAGFISCSESEPDPTESFFRIYDDANTDLSYNPIDVVEISDGYIILTGTELNNTDFMGAQLMRVDDMGNYTADLTLTDYVVPVGDMQLIDSITYFFVMNPVSLNAVLIGVNSRLEIATEATLNGINYPLASSITSTNDLLLLSYDPVNLETQISRIGTDGSFLGGSSYTIGAGSDVEANIINHYLRASEQPLPFFCGEVSAGNYFFNGFYNFSFSMVFTDFSAAPGGVLQGQSSDAGVRAALPLSGGNFAIAGYQFDDNFQLPTTVLNTTGTTSSVDLYQGNLAELKSYTPSKIISYTEGASTYTVFAAESKGRQIVLYFYDSASGEIAGIKHLGFLNPFTFSSIKATENNSISVLGTTFVAGRFERITLTKLSAGELSDVLK